MDEYEPGLKLDWAVASQVMKFTQLEDRYRPYKGQLKWMRINPLTGHARVERNIPPYSTQRWAAEEVVKVVKEIHGTDLSELNDPFLICKTALLVYGLTA